MRRPPVEPIASGTARSPRGACADHRAGCWRSPCARRRSWPRLRATRMPTDAGTGTLVDTDTRQLPGDAGAAPGVRRRPGRRPRRGRPAAAGADLEPGAAAAARGLPLGQGAGGGEADPGPCAELARLRAGRVRRRPGDLPQRGGDPDRPPAEPARRARCRPTQLREFLLAVAARYGITSAAQPRQPRIHRRGRLRPAPRARARRRPASPTSSPTATRRRSSCGCGPT